MGFPDISEVTAAVEGGGGESAPETGGAGQTDLAPDAAASTAAEVLELDKHEKFKFENEELTPQQIKEWKKGYLRQSDYTRKTQEFAQERRYYDNLRADLRLVRENPTLASEFRKVYPEKFHTLLEDFLAHASGTPAATPATTQQQQQVEKKYADIDPQWISRFEKVESTILESQQEKFEMEVSSIQTSLEAQEKEFSTKYPWADVQNVYSKAQTLLDKNKDLPKEEQVKLDKTVWEKLYKSDHEKNTLRFDNYQKERINQQKQAGFKAKDAGLGGGSPGSAPKRHKSIREATSALLSDEGLDS